MRPVRDGFREWSTAGVLAPHLDRTPGDRHHPHAIQDEEEPVQPQLPSAAAKNGDGHDIVEQIKRVHELYQAGVLTEVEYEAKKAELLTRI